MTVFAGGIIYAVDINNLKPAVSTKLALTSRTSTTTLAADVELTGIPLDVGTYSIRLLGFWNVAAGTAPGIKTQWRFTGTWTSFSRALSGQGVSNASSPTVTTQMNVSASADNVDANYQQTSNTPFATIREEADNVVVTVAGNLSLFWAQSTSSTAATNLQPGTSFRIQKVS